MPFRGGASSIETMELHARRLEMLVEHLPALTAYWDRDLRNVIANSAYIEWFGKSPEQMYGMHIREVLGEETYAKNLPFLLGVLAGEEQHFERTLVDPGGRVRHVQASYLPDIVDQEVYGFFVLVTDITARVEAQRSLDEAQRLAELGSWSMNLPSGEITWSDELYRIFGLDRDELVLGVDQLTALVDDRDRARVLAQLDDARTVGEGYEMTYRIRRADGSVREVQSRGLPQRGADGSVVRLTGTVQDVTKANAEARELARINGELQKVNQLNSDVLAMLGHDVRAPLAVVLGFLEALAISWDDTDETQRRDFVDRAASAAQRLRTLVDDILSMATVDSGRIPTYPVEIRLQDHVREALAAIQDPRQPEVEVAGAATAFADPFHVRQVVANLVTNAFRYGAAPVRIDIAEVDEHSVSITVRDRGPGVPQDRIGVLFDRFVAHEPTGEARVPGSSGFGLYIAAGLASANGGSLRYVPTPGGATFCLTLPRYPGAHPRDGAEGPREDDGSP